MNSSTPKRVVLCDDHEIVREAIKARMAAVEGVEIVKELEPDVCIVDVELPGKDGIDATKDILKARPETRVIIFTAHAQPDLLTLALRAGASGYVLKSAPSEDIARAIEVLAEGLRVKQIADRLSLSPATVHTHVRNAIARMEVDTRTEAVALAVRFSYLGAGGSV